MSLEVDPVSRAAHIQAGARGPVLEEQLAPHGLTLRFYPQSFELSTLGGWVATHAGGVIRDGADAHRRPRGVGPGGHGGRRRVGVAAVAGARARGRRRTDAARVGGDARGDHVGVGARAAQAGVSAIRVRHVPLMGRGRGRGPRDRPVGPRARQLPVGLRGRGSADVAGDADLLVLGFEDAVEGADRALSICRSHGGHVREGSGGGGGAWRDAFLRAPYLRDLLVSVGVLSEILETAVTWDRLPDLVSSVRAVVLDALGGAGSITCRLTHAYPDGAAPYFTVLAPARRGHEEEQWRAIKAVAGDAVIAAGGTITHHHAVGRDHRPWYDRQRPDPFARAMRAAKDGSTRTASSTRGYSGREDEHRRVRQDMQAVCQAKEHHDKTCPWGGKGTAVHLSWFDIERMGWEEGDIICGLVVVGDERVATGMMRVTCDAEPDDDHSEEEEVEEVVEAVSERELVTVSPQEETSRPRW